MKIIVGLGNPGEKYENTRHNLGFVVLDALLQKKTSAKQTVWRENKKAKSLLNKIDDLILAKPQTLMNASGIAVSRLVNFYQPKPLEIWVIHDDLDLPLGKIKVRKGGGTAGHRGIDSVVKELGTADFVRFRLGIGHPGLGSSDDEVKDYVLAPLNKDEKTTARKMVERAVEIIEFALEEGLEKTMNRYNP
jgi:PTH1 family peptidyl-tRNA hydrolase